MKRPVVVPLAVALLVLVAGCIDQSTSPDMSAIDGPSFAKSKGKAEAPVDPVVEFVNEINARFEAAGQSIRLDYPWVFTVGHGTDPYARLRTGGRWPHQMVGYILDEYDYVAVDGTELALASAFDTWNYVRNTSIEVVRVPYPYPNEPGKNFDVLDGTFEDGVCIDIFDYDSQNYDVDNGWIFPESDIVVGGWVDPEYFVECLGSQWIIGVTWTFSVPDQNGDHYHDILYVEQFYNPAFDWVTSGAEFLGAGTDIETIALHENGHALGLEHFGGPLERQPFKLQPNGKVFNPTAVMNPIYLGGESRELLPTDKAALRTMYARNN
jgi:hypothetical protein